jgi:hypothetical protein
MAVESENILQETFSHEIKCRNKINKRYTSRHILYELNKKPKIHQTWRRNQEQQVNLMVSFLVHSVKGNVSFYPEDDVLQDIQPQAEQYEGQQDGRRVREYFARNFFS